MKPKVSIIILNWNGLKDTAECLDSLKKIAYPNYEVIVVDNASVENEAGALEKKYGNYIRVVRNKENLGFAGGNNIGINLVLKEGASKYVLLLNNDTTVESDFLDEMVRAGEEGEKIGMVGGKIYYYRDPEKIWYGGGKIVLSALRAPHEIAEFRKTKSVSFITGCLMLIKTAVFKEVGLLSEDYFLTVEDWDFSYCVGKIFTMKVTPFAVIYHKVSAATGGERSSMQAYYCRRNRWIFMKKFVKNPFARIIAVFFYFLSFVKVMVLPIIGGRITVDWTAIAATRAAIEGETGKRK
jgi:hypothetical protein